MEDQAIERYLEELYQWNRRINLTSVPEREWWERHVLESVSLVRRAGLSGDGSRLISGDTASQVIVWDLAARKPVAKWSGFPWNWIVAASLSPDGKTALVSENRYKSPQSSNRI